MNRSASKHAEVSRFRFPMVLYPRCFLVAVCQGPLWLFARGPLHNVEDCSFKVCRGLYAAASEYCIFFPTLISNLLLKDLTD